MSTTLNTYQTIAAQTAKYPDSGTGSYIALAYVCSKVAGEAGEVAENFGKAIRDDGYMTHTEYLTNERRAKMILEGGDVLWYIARLATELGITLEEMAHQNIEKLADRNQRDIIHGEGDDR